MIKKIKLNLIFFLIICLYFYKNINISYAENSPIPIDSRIKTLIYSPNEIFQLKFVTGYQSIIEFEKGEEIEMVAFGDPVPWSLKAFSNRIFLKATDPGSRTNMTIITNRRTYLLEISSTESSSELDDNVVLMLRFFYPEINLDIPKTTKKTNAAIQINSTAMNASNLANNMKNMNYDQIIADTSNINTNYSYIGDAQELLPIRVFDNGLQTFFEFQENQKIPMINSIESNGREIPLKLKRSQDYIVAETIEKNFALRDGGKVIYITNEKNISRDKMQAKR